MKQFLADFWRILRSDKSALVGAILILIYIVAAILGPILVHVNSIQGLEQAYETP